MTEHLPECFNTAHMTAVDAPCICDRLRACEKRVTRAVMHTVDVDSYEQGKRDCKATHPVLALKEITRIASKGYDTGLDAAREAVAAIEYRPTNPETMIRSMALDAIDALKEKR